MIKVAYSPMKSRRWSMTTSPNLQAAHQASRTRRAMLTAPVGSTVARAQYCRAGFDLSRSAVASPSFRATTRRPRVSVAASACEQNRYGDEHTDKNDDHEDDGHCCTSPFREDAEHVPRCSTSDGDRILVGPVTRRPAARRVITHPFLRHAERDRSGSATFVLSGMFTPHSWPWGSSRQVLAIGLRCGHGEMSPESCTSPCCRSPGFVHRCPSSRPVPPLLLQQRIRGRNKS